MEYAWAYARHKEQKGQKGLIDMMLPMWMKSSEKRCGESIVPRLQPLSQWRLTSVCCPFVFKQESTKTVISIRPQQNKKQKK